MATTPFKRTDGRWVSYVDNPLTGKRKPIYGHSRPECKRKAADYEDEAGRGDLTNKEKLTVKGYFEKWIKTYCKSLSPTTIINYESSLNNHVYPVTGDMLLYKVLPINIQEILNKMQDRGRSEKTQLNVYRIIHKAFDNAKTDKAILSNPCDGVKPPSPSRPKVKIYSDDQFNSLLDVVDGTREEIPIVLAAMAGLRRGEICGLRWEDIDFDTGRISIVRNAVRVSGKTIVKEPKTEGSIRSFILPEYVLDVLKKYRGFGYVYPGENGEAMNGDTLSKRLKDLLWNNNLPKTTLHPLRHYNATAMLKRGVPDKKIASRLGHQDANITKRYQHVLEDMDRETANVLDMLVSKRSQKQVSN